MSRFHEEIKQTLIEVEHFLLSTLRNVSLPAAAKREKASILSHIDKLRENYSSLLPPREGTEEDVSGGTTITVDDGSSESAGYADQDDSAYSDSIAPIPATELYNTSKGSILLKRRKPGSKALMISAYQKRWCVLKSNIFYYYEKHTDKKQTGAFYITGYEFRDAPFLLEKEPQKKDLSFELIRPGHRVYQFLATNKEDYADWKEAITKAALIVDKPSPQVTHRVSAPAPPERVSPRVTHRPAAPLPPVDGEGEEVYEPIDETSKEASVESQRPVSEEIYDAIEADKDSAELYDDCAAAQVEQKLPAAQLPQLPTAPPPQLPTASPPQLPTAPPPQVPTVPPPQVPPTLPPALGQTPPQLPSRGPPKRNADGIYSAKLPELPPRSGKDAADTRQVTFPDFKYWKLGVADDYENMYYGKWDCDADEDDELGFKRGDVLHILSKEYDSQQWWIAELGGQVGLVPKVYLTEAYQLVD